MVAVERERFVGGRRFQGVLQTWSGERGFIVPSEEAVSYLPENKGKGKGKNRIFVSAADFSAKDVPEVGSTVSFVMTKDSLENGKQGLGAQNVRGPNDTSSDWKKGGGKGKKAGGKGKSDAATERAPAERPIVSSKGKGKGKSSKGEQAAALALPSTSGGKGKGSNAASTTSDKVAAAVAKIAGKGAARERAPAPEPKEEKKSNENSRRSSKGGKKGGKGGKGSEDNSNALVKGLAAICSVLAKGSGKGAAGKGKSSKAKGKGKGKPDLKTLMDLVRGALAPQQANRKRKGGEASEERPSKKRASGEARVEYDSSLRERVIDEPSAGTVVYARKNWGMIVPSESLEHVDGKLSKIFVHASDMAEGSDLFKGAEVTFKVYKDFAEGGNGARYGADEVTVVGGEKKEKEVVPKSKMMMSAVKNLKTKQAAAKADKPKPQFDSSVNLPRTRLTEHPVDGIVQNIPEGKNIAWIQLKEPFEHAESKKTARRVIVHKNDVLGEEEALVEGQAVEFHIYKNEKGFGAEECCVSW